MGLASLFQLLSGSRDPTPAGDPTPTSAWNVTPTTPNAHHDKLDPTTSPTGKHPLRRTWLSRQLSKTYILYAAIGAVLVSSIVAGLVIVIYRQASTSVSVSTAAPNATVDGVTNSSGGDTSPVWDEPTSLVGLPVGSPPVAPKTEVSISCSPMTPKRRTPTEKLIDMRVLVIAPLDKPIEQSATLALDALNIPYDVLVVPPDGVPRVDLVTPDGRAKYMAVVFASRIEYAYADGSGYRSAVTAEQMNQLAQYETTYSIRRVILSSLPSSTHGTSPARTTNATTTVPCNVTFNSVFVSPVGIRPAVLVESDTVTRTPALIVNAATTTPVAYFEPLLPLFPNRTIAAVVAALPSNRTELHVYFQSSTWSTLSLLFNHVWINWATRGIFQGRRRVVLDAQVDDMFLSTQVTAGASPYAYRAGVADLTNLQKWQANLNSRLPNGSAIRLHLAYNGNGISAIADRASYYVDMDLASHVDQNFVKPLGSGMPRWPAKYTSQWKQAVLATDEMYRMFAGNPANQSHFFFVSHTYTHLNLNDAAPSDIVKEIAINAKMASSEYLGLNGTAWFSPRSLVTPQVSGLFNGDLYAALTAAGISAVVGDNSRTNIVPKNVYHPFRTTPQGSNYGGFLVVPRQPTTQSKWDWNQLLNYEADRVTKMLLALRQDPHMMHQANLRNADMPEVIVGSGKGRLSLLQQWVEAVVASFTRLVDWPIVTLRMDDLALDYEDRENRDTVCNPTTTLHVSYNGVVGALSLTAQSYPCRVPITLPNGLNPVPTTKDNWTISRIGNSPPTMWATLSECDEAVVEFQTSSTDGLRWD
ncbi:hypothetical protein M427DRAFT_32144 [Gonapodya prolifera JEL478]|uniref:Uncharacterized protein n=1 Tax=Gonapodya prolifera (strain JEL478) TaxID=1344416 RepID=A0A139AH31_GONPJ|nr:hypothetical protein M427DRAFT_32144 [Gonapodya prolifera JEL478]|eukprot:KXS15723.1 hypothetical protein M427DRAFT_32144 [Gonapodya prolifera JEL478]